MFDVLIGPVRVSPRVYRFSPRDKPADDGVPRSALRPHRQPTSRAVLLVVRGARYPRTRAFIPHYITHTVYITHTYTCALYTNVCPTNRAFRALFWVVRRAHRSLLRFSRCHIYHKRLIHGQLSRVAEDAAAIHRRPPTGTTGIINDNYYYYCDVWARANIIITSRDARWRRW